MSEPPFQSDSVVISTEQVPFVRPDLPESAELAEAFRLAVDSGLLTKGPQLEALEAESAAALRVNEAVGVSSCTVGLALVLKALAERDREAGRAEVRDK